VRAGGFRALVVSALLLGSVVGCGDDGPGRNPISLVAGRACQVVPFDAVDAALGVRFDVAGSSHLDQTDTCVLGQTGHSLPDLMLAASATEADDLIFRAVITPSDATDLPGLGRGAYQQLVAASPGTGPSVEIGWLSAAPKLLVLRFTFAAGAGDAEAQAMAAKLLTLAQSIEHTVVNPSLP